MIRSLLIASVRFRLLLLAIAGGLLVLGATQLPRLHSDVLPETW